MSITPLNKFLSHLSVRDRHRSIQNASSQAQSESGVDFSERVQRKLFSTIQRPSSRVRKRPSITHLPLVAGPEYGVASPGSPLSPFATHMISSANTNPLGAFPASPNSNLGGLEGVGGLNEDAKEKEKEKEDKAKSLRKSVRRSFQSLTQRPSSAPGTRPLDENAIATGLGTSARGPAPPRPPRPEERAQMAQGLERTSDSIISMTEALGSPPTSAVLALPSLGKPSTPQTQQISSHHASPPMSLRSSLSLSKRSSFPPFVAPASPILEYSYDDSPRKRTQDSGPWVPPFAPVPANSDFMIPGAWSYSNPTPAKTAGSQKGSPSKLRLKRKTSFSNQGPIPYTPSNYENSLEPASATVFPTSVLGAFTSPEYDSPSKLPLVMTFPEFAPGPLRISQPSSPQNLSPSTFSTPALHSQHGSPLKASTATFPSAEVSYQTVVSSPKPPFTAQGPKFPERVPNAEELDLWWNTLAGKQKLACKEIFETLTGLFDSTYPMLMPDGEEEGEYRGVEKE